MMQYLKFTFLFAILCSVISYKTSVPYRDTQKTYTFCFFPLDRKTQQKFTRKLN